MSRGRVRFPKLSAKASIVYSNGLIEGILQYDSHAKRCEYLKLNGVLQETSFKYVIHGSCKRLENFKSPAIQ